MKSVFSKEEVEMLLHGLNCARVNMSNPRNLKRPDTAAKLKVIAAAKAKLEVSLRADF
jgi:hypothetical protein